MGDDVVNCDLTASSLTMDGYRKGGRCEQTALQAWKVSNEP